MILFYLAIVFSLIVIVLLMRKPLYVALCVGILTTILLYRLSFSDIATATYRFIENKDTLAILASMYLITILQKMLESRQQIKSAEADMARLFNSRRVTISGACLAIGLLPSAAAMVLCADIVKNQTQGYLDAKEQAFVTTWLKHVPESSLPTYPSVLLMASLSGVPMSRFLLFMIVPIITLYSIGYMRYLRRVPKEIDKERRDTGWQDWLSLIKHLWSLLLIIVLILLFGIGVVPAVLTSIILSVVIYHFTLAEMKQILMDSLEAQILVSTAFVLFFKEFLTLTGALEALPIALEALPIPSFLIFVLLFFLGGIISGASGIIALGTPLAFSAIPDGGVALLVLLMCTAHAASQLSPVHVCLTVVSAYYQISLTDLMRRAFPASILFLTLMIVYYLILVTVL